MRTWTNTRGFSSLVAAAYVLAITTAGLFHNHAACPGDGDCRHSSTAAHEETSGGHSSPHPGPSRQCSADDSRCPVCQFLAQKPAPAAAIGPINLGALVRSVVVPAPARIAVEIFSAWRSRAPPAAA